MVTIPRGVAVYRAKRMGRSVGRASHIAHYDTGLSRVFRYFLVGDPKLVGQLTNSLGKGYSENGYGPFWPSFASVNDGGDGKVLWLSEAGLNCLQVNLKGKFLFQVEADDDGMDLP